MSEQATPIAHYLYRYRFGKQVAELRLIFQQKYRYVVKLLNGT